MSSKSASVMLQTKHLQEAHSLGIMYLEAVKFKNLTKGRNLVEILSQALRSCNKMLFLAIKSIKSKSFYLYSFTDVYRKPSEVCYHPTDFEY